MGTNKKDTQTDIPRPLDILDIADQDIYDAMKNITGYLDITPGDFKEVYTLAFRRAVERLTRDVKGQDVMIREVITVEKMTPLRKAATLMAEAGISGVPVIEHGNRVAGVLSEKDFLSHMGIHGKKTFMSVVAECLEGTGCLAVSIQGHNAEDIMSFPAITIYEDTPVMEIANIMMEKRINRIPVLDKTDRLVGIVSRGDILKWFFLKTLLTKA